MRKYTLNNKDGVSEKKNWKNGSNEKQLPHLYVEKKQWVVNSHCK